MRYFCNCLNHRNGIKWHKFTTEECRTRQCWLSQNGQSIYDNVDIKENSGEACGDDRDPPDVNPGVPGNDMTAVLVPAMNIVDTSEVLKDMIADIITTATSS